MYKPQFSVIIPTFNEENFIHRLLVDLEVQEEMDFEVIVVDGNSSDRTSEVIQGFKGEMKLTFLQMKKNNVSRQRNLGAKMAKGKYLVFLDADVQLNSNFLKLLKSSIKSNKSQFLTTYIRSDSGNFWDEFICMLTNIGSSLAINISKPFVQGYNFILERQLFRRVGGFNPQIVFGEDADLAFRLHKSGVSPIIVPEPKLIYSLRRHRAEGRIKVMWKFAQSTYHQLTFGAIRHKIFDYPMGGGWYKEINSDSQNN
jgi:glycosyltransferase involved in cell wall biosynthesis